VCTRPLEAPVVGAYVWGLSDRDVESLLAEAGLGHISKSAETDLRRDWETRHRDRSWADMREHVREGWDETLRLREEQLVASKERVRTGQVEIGKRVVEEKKTMEVPVTREEVVVERRPVNRPSDTPVGADADRTIEVPVTEERVDVEKRTVVREEIGVKKQVRQETVPISGTVRREEAVIEKKGDVPMAGQGAGVARRTWESEAPHFRQHWQSDLGSKGRWEEYEPYYRYGFDQYNSGPWSGRPWREVEPELRRDWSVSHSNQSWDVASNPIEHAWHHLNGTPHTHTR
jgi:uncharacterized protein (TIGR02271 family)